MLQAFTQAVVTAKGADLLLGLNNAKGRGHGETYRQRVEKRFGSVLQGRLDAVGVPRVERAIREKVWEESRSNYFESSTKKDSAERKIDS